MKELKASLRQFLNGLKGGSYEFNVNGNILEAKLYDTGVREVLEKIDQSKASMLYHSDQVFQNARYLYSTPDYDGDPNVYRWNYFYTPVQIGDEIVGVRIAVRDMVRQTDGSMDSQIYNWGIKTGAALDGGERGNMPDRSDVSSATPEGAALDGGRPSTKPPSSDVSSVAPEGAALGTSASSVNPSRSSIPQSGAENNINTAEKAREILSDGIFTGIYGEEFQKSGLSYAQIDDALVRIANGQPGGGQNVSEVLKILAGNDGPRMLPTASDAGPESSVGAARYGFDEWSNFQNQKSEFFPEGPNAARPVNMPTTDQKGRPISKSAATTMGAKGITDETAGMIAEFVLSGKMSYNRRSNSELIRTVENQIRTDGFQRSLERYSSAIQNGVLSDEIVVLGEELLVNASNAKDSNAVAEILSLYPQMSRNSGRAQQAMSILRKLSPTSQLYAAQKAVSNVEKVIKKGRGEKVVTKNDAKVVSSVFKEQRDTAISLIQNIISSFRGGSTESVGWVEQLGKDLSSRTSSRASDSSERSSTIYQTILNDLSSFMSQYVDRGKLPTVKRTAAQKLSDFFRNRNEYARAWEIAQKDLKEKYKDNQAMLDRLEDFLQNGIAYNAVGTDGVMMRAVADSALENDVSLKEMVIKSKYDSEDLINTISNSLIKDTGATGSDQVVIRDAVTRFVNEKTAGAGKTAGDYISSDIKKTMRELGQKMSDIIKQGAQTKEALSLQIADMLVSEYGISDSSAQSISSDIVQQFNEMVADASRSKLEQIFKEKPERVQKTAMQRFTELANMGAFSDPNFNAKAVKKVFGTVDISIKQSLIDEFLQQTDQAGRDTVMEKIYQDVADQIPANWVDKWNAWRYMSMLVNPRTHIQNMGGNLFWQPVRIANVSRPESPRRYGFAPEWESSRR